MDKYVILAILVMAIVTYFIRVLPLTLIRREIKNRFIKSFLYYVPFVTLAVMIFPGILDATASRWSALAGFILALFLSYYGGSLFVVSIATCVIVFAIELFLY